MGHPLDPDPVLAARAASSAASQLVQKALPPRPGQDAQRSFTGQPYDETDFNQPRSTLQQYERSGSRSRSIDVPRATLFPYLQRTEAARSAQEVKFSPSALQRFYPKRLRKKNPSVEKNTRRAIGEVNSYSDGTEGVRSNLKIYESFTRTSGRSGGPRQSPHNPPDGEGQPDNYNKEVVATSLTIPVQNENPIAGQAGNVTAAIDTSSTATATIPSLSSDPDPSAQIRTDSKVHMHGRQSCTGSHNDFENQLAIISQQRDRLVEEKDDLRRENWQLNEMNRKLQEENRTVRSVNVNSTLAEQCERLTNQNKELNRQCGNLVKENQQLRFDLKLQSEKELMAAFQTLCCEIANICAHYSQVDEIVEMHPETIRSIEDLLQIRDRLSRAHLNVHSYRLALSMACLSELLVRKVFHDPAFDIGGNHPKDLWAEVEMAEDIANIERNIYGSDLTIEDYHRWRCMTIRFLSHNKSDSYDRVEPVLRHFLQLYGKMFRLSEDSIRDLESELRLSVMIKAVDLSLCLRSQRSLLVVRTFGGLDDYHQPPDDKPYLVTRPELVRLTSAYGEGIENTVLVASELHRFHKKGVFRSNSGSERRRKDLSLPFSKKAAKAKSSV